MVQIEKLYEEAHNGSLSYWVTAENNFILILDSFSLRSPKKKQRKARTAFTDHQLATLEKAFDKQKYLSVQDRMELASKLQLNDTQVKTWYQNRR